MDTTTLRGLLVTYTISIDADGNVFNDVQTHGRSFAEVYWAFCQIKKEVDRQIAERRKCPFNPAFIGPPNLNDHTPALLSAAEAAQSARAGLEPFARFADALSDAVPDDIAIGIYADGGMHFGPSGGASVGDLRRAASAIRALGKETGQ